MVHILVLHGPNLNLLGVREPAVYGAERLDQINARLAEWARTHGVALEIAQTNHEGGLIELLHQHMEWADGVVINPGGYAHTSIALADAVRATGLPTIEVHLTNILAREPFRHQSVVAQACVGVVAGLGGQGYLAACAAMAEMIASGKAVASGPRTGGVA